MNDRTYYSARDEAANTYEIQSFLRYISRYVDGIPAIVPDGIYGPETRDAVKAFQAKVGLPPTGELDFETWTEIVLTYDSLRSQHKLPQRISAYPLEIPFLKEGDNFEEIYLLQIMLRRIAKIFSNITMPDLTGVYDKKTVQAVNEFGRLYGKDARGNLDRELWNALTNTYNSFTHNV